MFDTPKTIYVKPPEGEISYTVLLLFAKVGISRKKFDTYWKITVAPYVDFQQFIEALEKDGFKILDDEPKKIITVTLPEEE
jgi:hypothetical protein